jgi:hypothetical protein
MAYNFVTNGINTGFWVKNDKWKCSSDFSINNRLRGLCIIGVGISGRPEAGEILENVKNESLTHTSKLDSKQYYRFDGAIVEAVF